MTLCSIRNPTFLHIEVKNITCHTLKHPDCYFNILDIIMESVDLSM